METITASKILETYSSFSSSLVDRIEKNLSLTSQVNFDEITKKIGSISTKTPIEELRELNLSLFLATEQALSTLQESTKDEIVSQEEPSLTVPSTSINISMTEVPVSSTSRESLCESVVSLSSPSHLQTASNALRKTLSLSSLEQNLSKQPLKIYSEEISMSESSPRSLPVSFSQFHSSVKQTSPLSSSRSHTYKSPLSTLSKKSSVKSIPSFFASGRSTLTKDILSPSVLDKVSKTVKQAVLLPTVTRADVQRLRPATRR
ncbi:hypothetical protein ADUPG1_013968, partial [Aduncisulcus paluster]